MRQDLVYISILDNDGDFLSKNCLPLNATAEKSNNSFYTLTDTVLLTTQNFPRIFNKPLDFSWYGLQHLITTITTKIIFTSEHRKAFPIQHHIWDVPKALSFSLCMMESLVLLFPALLYSFLFWPPHASFCQSTSE